MALSQQKDLVAKASRQTVRGTSSRSTQHRQATTWRTRINGAGSFRTSPLTRKTMYSATSASTQAGHLDDAVKETKSTLVSTGESKYRGKVAVVVGAGPAGSAAAAYLAKHGFIVKVFEKRGDLRKAPENRRRSYPIALRLRAVDQVLDLGVRLPSSEDDGFVDGLHVSQGMKLAWGNRSNESINRRLKTVPNKIVGSRYAVAKALINAVEANHREAVSFYFDHNCIKVSFPEQTITFKDRNGSLIKTEYDMLVGADGANSVVRKELSTFDKEIAISVIPQTSWSIGVPIADTAALKSSLSEMPDPGWIVLGGFRDADGEESFKSGRLISHVQEDGSVQLHFIAPKRFFETVKEKGNAWAYKIMPENFPTEWTDELCSAMMEEEKVAPMPSVIRVSKLAGPATVLIGDAGHSITPSLGFGCNLAIEDGKILFEALDRADGDIALALTVFDDMRRKDVHGYQLLEEGCGGLGLQLSGWKVLWKWIVTAHDLFESLLAQHPGPMSDRAIVRLQRGEVSPRRCILIVLRDAAVLMLAALVAIFLAASLISTASLI